MIMAKLKSAKGKKFLFGLLAVFIIAASVVTRATIGGVIECNQVNHLIPTRVLVKGGEITCKILK
ncbi:DUF2534 family protein [Escherichia coli]|uniref:DUF2534 family protein n=1 Tax=Escherichia coli TaxID=562 RepID=UPI000C1C1AAC|nr:hypothetical protein PV0838_1961 [Escherichia coli]